MPVLLGKKSLADSSAEFGADGDVLQVGVATAQPACCRNRLVEIGVNPAGFYFHKLWQGINVGAAQFAEANGWGVFNYLNWSRGLEIIAVVIILDLMIYIQHVLVHVIPFFWRFHIVHHSDLDLDEDLDLHLHFGFGVGPGVGV